MSLEGSPTAAKARRRILPGIGVFVGLLLVTLGVFASNGWLPRTDPLSGEKYGWFGKKLPKHATGISERWVLKCSDVNHWYYSWGTETDIPGSADFYGDGRADVAVYRPSTQHYYSINSSNGASQYIRLGQTGDKAVASDYDGDGKADYAIYNSSTATLHVRQSSNGQIISTQWGTQRISPVHNDYDGRGKTDLATWRNSDDQWTI